MAAKGCNADNFSRNGSMPFLSSTRSILFSTRTTGLPCGSSASTFSSRAPKRIASTTNSTASTSDRACVTVRFITRLSAFWCSNWKPGVSTNTYCASSAVRMPVMRWRVVCALREVMLTFCPTR